MARRRKRRDKSPNKSSNKTPKDDIWTNIDRVGTYTVINVGTKTVINVYTRFLAYVRPLYELIRRLACSEEEEEEEEEEEDEEEEERDGSRGADLLGAPHNSAVMDYSLMFTPSRSLARAGDLYVTHCNAT